MATSEDADSDSQTDCDYDQGPRQEEPQQTVFTASEDRRSAMHESIEAWIDDLALLVDEARTSAEFRSWLDVQSRFHEYSYRNTLLIRLQCPEATKVAGYKSWQRKFDRQVQEGEQAIWIWAPIIAKQCPECGNSPSYHENAECEYDDTAPEHWAKGLVGFKPVSVFDISQTEGEPLPDLDTAAHGDGEALASAVLDAATSLDLSVRVVSADEWDYGSAMGICRERDPYDLFPVVEVKERPNAAALAGTLVHEYAHALLHFDVGESIERSKREVEAEAVAYCVGRYFTLDMESSGLYLAVWQDEESAVLRERLGRISTTAEQLIDTIEQEVASS